MPSRELSEWYAFSRIEPFGDARADFRAGIISSVVANVNIDPKKHKPFEPRDFIVDYDADTRQKEEKPTQTTNEQIAIVELLNTAFGGTDKRKNRKLN